MTDARISERLFDETVRVEHIIWIPGAVADPEATPDAFREEFVEWLVDGHSSELVAALPSLKYVVENSEDMQAGDVAERLIYTPGFLVQLATPVREFHGGDTSSFSWGYYRTGWIYVASEAELEPEIIKWAQAEVDRQKAKAAAKLAHVVAEQ